MRERARTSSSKEGPADELSKLVSSVRNHEGECRDGLNEVRMDGWMESWMMECGMCKETSLDGGGDAVEANSGTVALWTV